MTPYQIAEKGDLKEKIYQVLKDNDVKITDYNTLVKVVDSIANILYGA